MRLSNRIIKRTQHSLTAAVLTLSLILPMNINVSAEELMRLEEYQAVLSSENSSTNIEGVNGTAENSSENTGSAIGVAENNKSDLKLGAYTNGYDNMLYFSLRDFAELLNGTEKQFDFYLDYSNDSYAIVTGAPYSVAEQRKADEAQKKTEAGKREAARALVSSSPEAANGTDVAQEIRTPEEYAAVYGILYGQDGYFEQFGYYEDGIYKQNGRTYRIDENGEEQLSTFEGDYYDADWNIRDKNDQLVMVIPREAAVRPDYEYLALYQNPLMVNGVERRYYTCQLSAFEDIYMSATDIELMMDITIRKEQGGIIHVYTENGFEINLDEYVDDGYFDLFNGVVLGDATTGEILFGRKADNMDAIASTSKLMTYLVVSRYIELGRISLDDEVTLSQNVENLAYSGNGTLYMDAGQKVTVRDLLGTLMLASSNESALALAEYVAGSEEAFVVLMNRMADLLGLDTARFYNSNGLEVYSNSIMASKCQNRMSAADLFRLSQAVIRKYPQVIDLTSQKWMYIPSLDYSVANTNFLLHNMDNCVGLKTGTTNEAGCCLVAAAKCDASDGEHILVAVILGAESNIDRYQHPAVLLKWGTQELKAKFPQEAEGLQEVG